MNENENKLFRQTEAERKREAYQQKKNGTRKPSITELVIVTMVRLYEDIILAVRLFDIFVNCIIDEFIFGLSHLTYFSLCY